MKPHIGTQTLETPRLMIAYLFDTADNTGIVDVAVYDMLPGDPRL